MNPLIFIVIMINIIIIFIINFFVYFLSSFFVFLFFNFFGRILSLYQSVYLRIDERVPEKIKSNRELNYIIIITFHHTGVLNNH